jgi:hypothetical protein
MEAFELRLWDNRIGRWLTTDPYRQYHSPYLGMGNDPINSIDPDGGWETKWSQFWAWVGNGFRGERYTSDEASGVNKYGISFKDADAGSFFTTTQDGIDSWNAELNVISNFKHEMFVASHESINGWTPFTTYDSRVRAIAGLAEFALPSGKLATKGTSLSEDVGKTFFAGRYEKVVLQESITLSRYYDNVFAYAKGRYMTNTTSITGVKLLDRIGLALRPKWNGMTKVAHWNIPAGTTIYKGRAGMQFPWIGGKTQYFVPNMQNIHRVIKP